MQEHLLFQAGPQAVATKQVKQEKKKTKLKLEGKLQKPNWNFKDTAGAKKEYIYFRNPFSHYKSHRIPEYKELCIFNFHLKVLVGPENKLFIGFSGTVSRGGDPAILAMKFIIRASLLHACPLLQKANCRATLIYPWGQTIVDGNNTQASKNS